MNTDPKRLTALVFLGIKDRETFPLIFYRHDCADMAIAADDIDARVHRLGQGAARLGHAPLAGADLRRLPRSDAQPRSKQARRVVLDIDYRPVLWGLTAPGLGEERFVASTDGHRALQTGRRRWPT